MFKRIKKHQNQKGFTLIELMVVIAIIGILAAIAIPQFAAYRNRSYKAELEKYANTLANAQEAYFVDHDKYAVATLEGNGTYGVPALKAYQAVNDWAATAQSFSFKVTDTVHDINPDSFVIYQSENGGLQP
ncbi:MAG: pilus assembly protein [Desulfobacterales bacterium]|nr:MAG: pilus assembly protein [Desulfobacterales bacterium]